MGYSRNICCIYSYLHSINSSSLHVNFVESPTVSYECVEILCMMMYIDRSWFNVVPHCHIRALRKHVCAPTPPFILSIQRRHLSPLAMMMAAFGGVGTTSIPHPARLGSEEHPMMVFTANRARSTALCKRRYSESIQRRCASTLARALYRFIQYECVENLFISKQRASSLLNSC